MFKLQRLKRVLDQLAHMADSKCGNDNCSNLGSKRCSSCKSVVYCGAECQKNHWAAHKEACKSLKSSTEPASAPKKVMDYSPIVADRKLMDLCKAVKEGDLTMVILELKELKELKVDINGCLDGMEEVTPLKLAAQYGKTSCVRCLLGTSYAFGCPQPSRPHAPSPPPKKIALFGFVDCYYTFFF
jgi:hypothetical protein